MKSQTSLHFTSLHFTLMVLFLLTQWACVKDDFSTVIPNSQRLAAFDGNSNNTQDLQTTSAFGERGSNSCNCELQILEAYSPVPSGGSGGFLGYDFICDYYGFGQSNYVFGAFATDCAIGYFPGTQPSWMVQVPSDNSPSYPAPSMYGYYPFLYDIPAFQSFNLDPGSVAWFNNDGCQVNNSNNEEGYLKVILRCCDDGESECQQCYYSDTIKMVINTGFGGYGLPAPVSLGGTCGCVPNTDVRG